MKISLNSRRFLLIWFTFHSFALATNLIPIKGEISIQNEGEEYRTSRAFYIFTDAFRLRNESDFWPFVAMYDENGYGPDRSIFRGIFYDYSIGAFLLYTIGGFVIVFLPLLWGNSVVNDNINSSKTSDKL